MLGVVGSRKATCYGLEQTRKLVETLAPLSPCVVSGLAYGIDTKAHQAAVEFGIPSVAVIGSGLGFVYPNSNRKLCEKMIGNGGLLTEFLYDSIPAAFHFPMRNRIIAGLSDAVVVMEARKRSGALITAGLAFSYSREVFAYPGRVNDISSEGCNELVAQNKATIVCSPSDVAVSMQWGKELLSFSGSVEMPFDMTQDERKLYDLIQYYSTPDVDTLVQKSGFPVASLNVMLLGMECKGLIHSLSGNRYCCR